MPPKKKKRESEESNPDDRSNADELRQQERPEHTGDHEEVAIETVHPVDEGAAADEREKANPEQDTTDGAEDEGADADEDETAQPEKDKTEGAEARDAAKAVGKQERLIEKLLLEKDSLAKKVKANKEALRVANEELETLKSRAKKKASAARKVKIAKLEEVLKAKVSKISLSKTAANRSVKSSKQRLEDAEYFLKSARKKANAAKEAVLRVQAKVEEAETRVKELQARGEHVPEADADTGEESAPGKRRKSGVAAGKLRDKARAELAKAKTTFEKAAAYVIAREKAHYTAETKLEEAKRKAKHAGEKKQELNDELVKVAPKSAKAKPKQAGKAKTKAMRKPVAMKVIKKPAGAKA